MTTNTTQSPAEQDPKAQIRAMWAQGDYHRFATELIWSIGEVVVKAARISAQDRVLDVAAGTGNVAVRAAESEARVVAVDLTPENFPAGQAYARSRGVSLDWVEGDAEALPFPTASFDVVTSCFGALFAPDHQRVAQELLRVVKPGGRIVMANFRPAGTSQAFFQVFGRHAPPPPAPARPPILWGDPQYVEELFGSGVSELTMTPQRYLEHAQSPAAYCEFFKTTFGPMVALYGSLDAPQRAAFDRDFLAFATEHNCGSAGRASYQYDYLLIVAKKALG